MALAYGLSWGASGFVVAYFVTWPRISPPLFASVSELQERLTRIESRLFALRQRRRDLTHAHQYSKQREIEEDINMLCRVRMHLTEQLEQQGDGP